LFVHVVTPLYLCILTPASWPVFASGAVDRVAAPNGLRMNGEMSQNTALAGLLSCDIEVRAFAGDLP